MALNCTKLYSVCVLLKGPETRSLLLYDEHFFLSTENIMLRTIFGLLRGIVTEASRKLLNEELYNLHLLQIFLFFINVLGFVSCSLSEITPNITGMT